MAENELPKPILFDFQEIVTEMVRKRGIHDGIWALFVEFGLTAANMEFRNPDDPNSPKGSDEGLDALLPTAIIPIKSIGIIPAPMESNISVDAAKVNPKPKRSSPARKSPKKK